MRKIFQHEGEVSRFQIESDSRPDEFHTVSFHLTSKEGYFEPRCDCESYTIGIPAQINKGVLFNTPTNRKCKHIRIIETFLREAAIRAVVENDKSQNPRGLVDYSRVYNGVKTTE